MTVSNSISAKRRTLDELNETHVPERTIKRSKAGRGTSINAKTGTSVVNVEQSDDLKETYRPPVIELNASQRLDLLKKRRERWRVSTLYNMKNFHARGGHRSHLNNHISALAPLSNTDVITKYVESSTQTDSIPTLASKTPISKSSAKDAAEKKLKQGVFSGLLFYDPAEIDESKHEGKSPVKFGTKARQNDITLGSAQNGLPVLNDSKKLIQIEALKTESKDDGKKFGPSAGFNFLSSGNVEGTPEDDEDDDDKPRKKQSNATNFQIDSGIHTSTPSISLSNGTTKQSLFGGQKEGSETGASKATGLSFGSSVEKKDQQAKPAFSFGGKSAEETSDSNKPAFSFGGLTGKNDEPAKPAFSFGGTSNEQKNDKSSKPSFNFGVPTEKNNIPASSTVTSSSEKAANPSSSATEPAKLSFGLTSSSAIDKTAETSKPAFSFGSAATEKKEEPAKTAFSFGSSIEKKEEPSKTGFSFGATTEKKTEAASSGFSFGSGEEKKEESTNPGFSFGIAKKSDASTKPSVSSFGSTGDNKIEPAKPSGFSFGASLSMDNNKDGQPTLFGPTAPEKSSAPSSGFSFGSKNDEPTNLSLPSKPSFNFGGSNADTKPSATSSTGFTFGTSGQSNTEKTEPKSAFGSSAGLFGSTTSENKPAAPIFGASSNNENKPSSVFVASSSTTTSKPSFQFGASSSTEHKPSFNFGATALPTSSTPAPEKPPTAIFGQKSASPAPFAFGNATSNNTNNPTDNKMNFNFGASTSQNPASVFGASQPQQHQQQPSAFGVTSTPASTSSSTTSLQPFGQPAQSGFGFGANTTNIFGNKGSSVPPTFGSQVPSTTTFGGPTTTGTPTSFNFGGATNANPSQIFSQTPSFGGAGAGPGSAPGTPTQQPGRVPGRKIAQMRSRRR